MRYTCPVCMFPRLPYPPRDYHICPCCGTEFGNDDVDFSYKQLREMWVAGGGNWFFGRTPEYWNPWVQLLRANIVEDIPRFFIDLRVQFDAVSEAVEIRNLMGEPVVRPTA